MVLQAKTGNDSTEIPVFDGDPSDWALLRGAARTSAGEYLLPDALGSVRQIADANGDVTLAESYEPYGSVLTNNGVNE